MAVDPYKCHMAKIEITYNDGRTENLKILFDGEAKEVITTEIKDMRALGSPDPMPVEREASHVFMITELVPNRLRGGVRGGG